MAKVATSLHLFTSALTKKGDGVFEASPWQSSEWMELTSFPNKVRPNKSMPQGSATWRTVEGIRNELRIPAFKDVEVQTLETYMPFETYDEVARFILTRIPGMSMMTGDMGQQELEKTRDFVVEYIKSKHSTEPSHLVGAAIVGLGRK
ncbi:hypothetical protein MMC25_003207 [Agyrium rufum]|nr:hypothetical protein [Agyrium rufum]